MWFRKKTFTKLLKFSKRVFRTPEKIYFKIRKGLFFHLPRKIIKNQIFLRKVYYSNTIKTMKTYVPMWLKQIKFAIAE
jgi:hypothetical protein